MSSLLCVLWPCPFGADSLMEAISGPRAFQRPTAHITLSFRLPPDCFRHRRVVVNTRQPCLHLAPSLFLPPLPIPRDTTQQSAHTPPYTPKRAPNTANHIPLSKLAYAITQTTRDAADSIISSLTYIPHHPTNRPSNCASQPSKPITNRIPESFAHARDSIA